MRVLTTLRARSCVYLATLGVAGLSSLFAGCISDSALTSADGADTWSGPPAVISLSDSILVPGAQLTFAALGPTKPTVTIGGVPLPVQRTGASTFAVRVPATLFEPCLGFGVRYDVDITYSGETTTFSRPATPTPLLLDLTVGTHAYPREAVYRGCPIEIRNPGEYLVVPYRFHVDEALSSLLEPPDIVTVLGFSRVPRTALAALRIGSDLSQWALPQPTAAPALRPERGAYEGIVPGDVVDLPLQLAGPAGLAGTAPTSVRESPSSEPQACTVPSTEGDSLLLSVARDSEGLFQGLWNGLDPEHSHFEYWQVLRATPRLTVIVDTAARRLFDNHPTALARLGQVLHTFEGSAVPFFDEYTNGIPNVDAASSQTALFISGTSGLEPVAQSYGSWVPRVDCHDPLGAIGRNGETIWISYAVFDPNQYTVPDYALHVLVHEIAHVVDLSLANGRDTLRNDRTWAVEGFATLLTSMWSQAHYFGTAPFTGNGSTKHRWDACVVLHELTLRNLYHSAYGSGNYGIACALVGAIIADYALASGMTIQDALDAWTQGPLRRQAHLVAGELTERVIDPVVFYGDWLLSWYADDLIADTKPTLRSVTFDLRHINAVNAGRGPFFEYYRGPVWSSVRGRKTMEEVAAPIFVEPLSGIFDVAFYEVSSSEPGWLTFTSEHRDRPGVHYPVGWERNVMLGLLRTR